jgi:hypothetical protein
MAHDHDVLAPRSFFLDDERPAEARRGAERLEEVGGDEQTAQALGLAVAG